MPTSSVRLDKGPKKLAVNALQLPRAVPCRHRESVQLMPQLRSEPDPKDSECWCLVGMRDHQVIAVEARDDVDMEM